jgi:hypothetical protein
MPIRKGPIKVVERNNDAYSVLDIVSRRTQEVHISRLFPFFYDDTRVDPETIALRDSENLLWNPSSMIQSTQKFRRHNGNFESAGRDMMNGVREDTWGSWNSLKHVEALHQYLRANGFSQYIPLSHKKLVDKKQKTKSGIVDKRLAITPLRKKKRQSS